MNDIHISYNIGIHNFNTIYKNLLHFSSMPADIKDCSNIHTFKNSFYPALENIRFAISI